MQDERRTLSWDEASYYVINKLSTQDQDIEKIGTDIAGIRKDMQGHFREDSQNMALIKEMVNASQDRMDVRLDEIRDMVTSLRTKDRVLTAIAGAVGGSLVVSTLAIVARKLFP